MNQNKTTYAESVNLLGKRVGEFVQKYHLPQNLEMSTVSTGYNPSGPGETTVYSFVSHYQRKRGFWDLFHRDRWLVIGILWLSNEARKANHKHWVLEVFGREHVEFFTLLVGRMSEEFKVEIHVRLESEQPRPKWYGTSD